MKKLSVNSYLICFFYQALSLLVLSTLAADLNHVGGYVSHNGNVASHNGNGVSHNGNGVSHNGNGVSHNGNGASHNVNGVSLNGNGASHNGNGGSHNGNGVSHNGNGVSHNGNGVSHNGNGVSHDSPSPFYQQPQRLIEEQHQQQEVHHVFDSVFFQPEQTDEQVQEQQVEQQNSQNNEQLFSDFQSQNQDPVEPEEQNFEFPKLVQQIDNIPSEIYQQPESALGGSNLQFTAQSFDDQLFVNTQDFNQNSQVGIGLPTEVPSLQLNEEFSNAEIGSFTHIPSDEQSLNIPQNVEETQDLLIQSQNNQEHLEGNAIISEISENLNEGFVVAQTLPQPLQPSIEQSSFQQVQTLPALLNPSSHVESQSNGQAPFDQVHHTRPQISEKPNLIENTKPLERPQVSVRPLPKPSKKHLNLDSSHCGKGLLVDLNGECVEPLITRNIFLYAAPKIESLRRTRIAAPKPKLEYNIVFVRNPVSELGFEPIIVPPPQQKTLVYVLNKKSEVNGQELIEAPSHPKLQPEVFFVNYDDGENPELPGGIDLQSALREMVLEGTVIDDFSSAPFIQNQDAIVELATTDQPAVEELQSVLSSTNAAHQGFDYTQQVITL